MRHAGVRWTGAGAAAWLAAALGWATGAPAETARPELGGDGLPAHAIARFGRAPLHHGTSLERLAFSPDGRVLASAAYRCRLNDIALWDVKTGRLLRSLGGGELRMYAMAFFPDGKTLVSTGMRGTVHFWDVASGEPTTRFRPPSDLTVSSVSSLMRLAVSPDGRTVAVHSHSSIEAFDAVTGQRRCTIREHYLGTFSPDGKLLAATGNSSSMAGARLFDSATGEIVREMDGGAWRCAAATFSPDGSLLAAVCTDGGNLRHVVLWETKTGRIARKLPATGSYCRQLAFHPDGALLAGASWTAGIYVWNAKAGKLLRNLTVPDELFMGVAFSPDGTLLAAGANSLPTREHQRGQIRLWDTTTWRQRAITAACPGPLLSAAASADGRRVLTGCQDGTATLWDGRTGRQLLRLPGHAQGATAVAVTRDGRSLFTAAGSGPVRSWDAGTGRLRREIPVPGGASQRIALLGGERELAAFESTGATSLVDLETGKVRLLLPGGEKSSVKLGLSPDGRVAATADRTLVSVRELLSGRRLGLFNVPGDSSLLAIALDPTARLLAGDGGQSKIALIELDSGRTASVIEVSPRFTIRGRQVAFSRDGTILAAAETNGGIGLWSVRTARKLGERRGHRGHITVLEFLADGKHLLSGGADGTAVLWGLEDMTAAALAEKAQVDPCELPALWSQLASDDAAKAHGALLRVVDAGDAAAAFLAERLEPVQGLSTDEVRRWIAELGDRRFAVRKRATQELARLGAPAEPPLRRTLAESTSEEVRTRVKQLLEPLDVPPQRSGQTLRQLRAVHILERIASPRAAAVLKKLSRGSPYATLTERAAAALERLDPAP